MYNSLTKPFRPNSFMDRLYPKQYAMGHHGNAFLSFAEAPFDDTGLKAYYKFDEASGDLINLSESAVDMGANADGANTGVTQGAVGIIDDAYDYDGVNNFTDLGSAANKNQWTFLTDGTTATINWWMNPDDWTTNETFLDNINRDGANSGLQVVQTGTKGLRFFVINGSTLKIDANSSNNFIITGAYHMYTILIDLSQATNSVIFKRDGNANTETFNRANAPVSTDPTDQLRLARPSGGGIQPRYDGRVDEMSIWSKLVSNDDLDSLYNSGAALPIY